MMKPKQKKQFRIRYGSWAVITGASSGIGRELSIRVAETGIDVIIIGRNRDSLKDLKFKIQKTYTVNVEIIVADLSEGGVKKVIEFTANKNVGLLIASAGFGTSGNFLLNSVHEEVNMLQVNCQALLELTHHFAQAFVNNGRGGIILLSSIVAFQGVPFSANYAATKAYVQSLAEGLHEELKQHNVDVLSAAPGPVNSGFSARANMKMSNALKPKDISVPILKALGKKTTVLPGYLTKILVYSLRTVPRWGKVKIMKKVMGDMTKHQREP